MIVKYLSVIIWVLLCLTMSSQSQGKEAVHSVESIKIKPELIVASEEDNEEYEEGEDEGETGEEFDEGEDEGETEGYGEGEDEGETEGYGEGEDEGETGEGVGNEKTSISDIQGLEKIEVYLATSDVGSLTGEHPFQIHIDSMLTLTFVLDFDKGKVATPTVNDVFSESEAVTRYLGDKFKFDSTSEEKDIKLSLEEASSTLDKHIQATQTVVKYDVGSKTLSIYARIAPICKYIFRIDFNKEGGNAAVPTLLSSDLEDPIYFKEEACESDDPNKKRVCYTFMAANRDSLSLKWSDGANNTCHWRVHKDGDPAIIAMGTCGEIDLYILKEDAFSQSIQFGECTE